ncbi:unnamed protein product [Adineta ricciae]|uniref:Uncharacterized protein n=2 Tax=Adineta ricciae TaxID=249248 RepID=A0A814X606_ADIRI|nr:unnamed protein product [Adineta ricciae]CAF1364286.1 unnamed protein product [Adineta ricciae]
MKKINSSRRSSTSSEESTNELDDRHLISTAAKSSKQITVCTLCGRYKGFRMSRYLFISLCVLLVLLLLLFAVLLTLYVIIPIIVRATIDKAQVGFHSVNIEQVEKDRFRLRAQLELSRTGSISATIIGPLIINVDNVGIVTVNESISIKGGSSGTTVVPIDSPFMVTNITAFHNFTRSLVFDSRVVWHLKAEATIQPLTRHMLSYSNIPFNKDVTLNALNGLPNVTINSINLNRSTEHNVFADINIQIVNPSLFSIDVGRLYFSLQYNNWTVGYVESASQNLTIHAGENSIQCLGELQSTSTESYQALLTIIQNYLTGQATKLEALAGPNVTSYPLLSIGMMGLSLSVPMPPFSEQLIVSLKFNSMSLTPSTIEKQVKLSASINIGINSPLGVNSPLNIQTMDMSVFLFYENKSVGMLNVTKVPVKQLSSETFTTKFTDEYLILTDAGLTYERFTQQFIQANQKVPISIRLVGVASIVGSFALGPLSVEGILVENDATLVGLDGFNDVQVDGIAVNGEEDNALRIGINATIGNPGVTSVQLQNFTLQMADGINGTILGHVPIDILAVQPGSNKIALNGFLAPTNKSDLPVVGQFFSAYLNGQTQSVRLFHGPSIDQNASALDLTISNLSMKADLQGIRTKLIRQVNVLNFGIEFDATNVNRIYITGELSVLFELPSNIHMTFKILATSINFTMRFKDGPPLGRMSLYDLPVQHNQTTNEILANFTRQELVVLDKDSFEEFAANLVLTNQVVVTIEGLTAALTSVQIGNLTLVDIPINDTLSLVGYSQFDNGHLIIDNIDITGSISSQALALHIKTQIINPSVVNIINGGRLTLDLCDIMNCTSFGTVNIEHFFLQPQQNPTFLDAEGIFLMTEQNEVVAREFISNMVSGIDSQVELRGTLPDNTTGTSIPLLSLAIAGLRIHSRVPGLSGNQTIIREILVKKLTAEQIIGIPLGLVKFLNIRVRLSNPFSTTITMQGMHIRADFGAIVDKDHQVGRVEDNNPIIINPHQELVTDYINVTLSAKLATMVALLGPLLAGNARLSLSGMIDVLIGENFTLTQLPLTVLNVLTDQEHA